MPIDYSKYPPNWKEIRERILLREGNKCKFCGVPNRAKIVRSLTGWTDLDGFMTDCSTMPEELIVAKYGNNHHSLQLITIVLTIAHLDHDEENHDVEDDRLAALCQRCHLRYDAPEKARRRAKKKYDQSLFPINEQDLKKEKEHEFERNELIFFIHYLGKEGLRYFDVMKRITGTYAPILQLNFKKKGIPMHSVHHREGMQIRNWMRNQNINIPDGVELNKWLDDNWTLLIDQSITLNKNENILK